ncbi:alpha/beta hydrolase [uncultured Mesonia sp.]|uniref:alpha/beta hydrolase n=1 Tax=uncultured Mesonia sp. TaxID=399731 RepID=UPI00374E7B9A
MSSLEKEVSYQHTNTYSTLNLLGPQTEQFWYCFHGMGYLSKYFARYFKSFDQQKNYFIVPQAPSKYYQKSDFKHVGASWLTKENTWLELENLFQYLDAVHRVENKQSELPLNILGYSQGVSIALRWIAKRKLNPKQIFIHSGSIPAELDVKAFSHLSSETKVFLIYGRQDQYLTKEKLNLQLQKARALFGKKLSIHAFDGKHVMNPELLKELHGK